MILVSRVSNLSRLWNRVEIESKRPIRRLKTIKNDISFFLYGKNNMSFGLLVEYYRLRKNTCRMKCWSKRHVTFLKEVSKSFEKNDMSFSEVWKATCHLIRFQAADLRRKMTRHFEWYRKLYICRNLMAFFNKHVKWHVVFYRNFQSCFWKTTYQFLHKLLRAQEIQKKKIWNFFKN